MRHAATRYAQLDLGDVGTFVESIDVSQQTVVK